MYLRFFGPSLVGIGDENGGGGFGDVGKIRRTYKALKYSTKAVDVHWINVKRGGVDD